MDLSPPPFHSSPSGLWAFHSGSFRQGKRQGRPGDSLGVEGRGPLLSTVALCWAPSSPVFPPGPLFAAMLSGDDFFYLEWRWVGISITGAPPFAPSFSFLLLCLWIGSNELGGGAMKVKTWGVRWNRVLDGSVKDCCEESRDSSSGLLCL